MVDAALKKTDLMIDGREITVKTAHQKLKKYDDERPPKVGCTILTGIYILICDEKISWKNNFQFICSI